MFAIKSFFQSENEKLKNLLISFQSDPIGTAIQISIQIFAVAIGFWIIIRSLEWGIGTITSAL
jgi:hypothetical protein